MLNQDVAGGSSISREYAFSLNGSTLAPGERLLEIADIDLRFGGIQALDGVGLTVAQGEIHSIIGPNGAGKSSLINCVSGLYRPQQGRIHAASPGRQRGARGAQAARDRPGA